MDEAVRDLVLKHVGRGMNTFQYFAEDYQRWKKGDVHPDTVRCMVDHAEHMASILKDIERELKR